MAVTPENISDSFLAELDRDFAAAVALASALDRLGSVTAEPPEPDLKGTRYDIEVEFVQWAPAAERFRAIDWNTYDGAPDSTGISTCIGLGPTRRAAIGDLLDQMADHQ